RVCREKRFEPQRHRSVLRRRRRCTGRPCLPQQYSDSARESKENPLRSTGLALGRVFRGRCSRGGRRGFMNVDEVLQFLAWLEKRNSLGRHIHFCTGLRIASDSAAALPRAEATKTANLNLVVLLQRLDNAFKHRLDN